MQHPLPGEGSPETQQRQQKQIKTTLSCYSLSASCLLCSVISFNSPYSVYSPHQERRNQSGNVSLRVVVGGVSAYWHPISCNYPTLNTGFYSGSQNVAQFLLTISPQESIQFFLFLLHICFTSVVKITKPE